MVATWFVDMIKEALAHYLPLMVHPTHREGKAERERGGINMWGC